MIEKIVLDYLNNVLDVPAYMENPETKKDNYIILEKTGGSQMNFLNSAIIVIQSYANTLYEAAKLNEKVKEVMNDIIILDSISKSKLNSDYNFTDTTKKQYRYQAVFEIFYY